MSRIWDVSPPAGPAAGLPRRQAVRAGLVSKHRPWQPGERRTLAAVRAALQLGEELTDLEDAFRLWRFRHVTTVERIIGFRRGTGGTGGASYLRKMLDVVLFPEIWRLRTDL